MPDFLKQQRTLENYWRAVILFGQNVASYKFALAKSLIDLGAAGQTAPFHRGLPRLRRRLDLP